MHLVPSCSTFGRYGKNFGGEQKDVITYKCLEEHIDLGRTKRVGEQLDVGVQVQVERECGEAETNVTQE